MSRDLSRFRPDRPLRNQRGSAIMFAIFLMSLLVFIAFEVSYDSLVEYRSSLNSVRRVQAYYAAKSCHDLSLLRIKAFQQVARSNIRTSIPDPTMLDMIWKFPLMWPITAPAEALESDKDAYKEAAKQSNFKHSFNSQITTVSGKIDINDLGSPSKALREKTKEQLLKYIQTKLDEPDSEWAKKYASFDFDLLFNHISDWIDSDDISLNGGSEKAYYLDLRNEFIPPNQSLKTMEELHMIKGMEDGIYDILVPAITLYGGKGINVNYADKDMLMAIDPMITDIVADEIIKRRNDPALGGPFLKADDFYAFLGVNPASFNQDKVPLYFDSEIHFEVNCVGSVGNISSEIQSVVYDYQIAQARIEQAIAEENAQNNPNNQQNDPCEQYEGDQKYDCECRQQKHNPGTQQYNQCIQQKRNAAQQAGGNNNNNSNSTPLPPGKPYIIHYEVK